MNKVLKQILKIPYNLFFAIKSDFYRLFWHQYFPRLPEGINMNANDICNSKCVMCNIWKQKKDFEFNPEELHELLKDPLYRKVKYVGITGGEPTLREDLPDLFESCIKALPSLSNLSIITNGIQDRIALNRIIEIDQICKKHKINFGAMISIDGVGIYHDKHRGRDGNFNSAIRLYSALENAGISVSFGCTITKSNVWGINEFYSYIKKNNYKGRFRIGEFIERLYHDEKSKEEIRSFDEEETYFLQNFFHRLSNDFSLPEGARRNYRNIFGMLSGKKRKMACPHHDRAVQLDSRGILHYCAPKSPSLGSGISISSLKIWKNNLKIRRDILKKHCDSCIHDYQAEVTFNELVSYYSSLYWQWFNEDLSKKAFKVFTFRFVGFLSRSNRLFNTVEKRNIFITGWYGTETTGDKAILGSIISHYKQVYVNVQFFIVSMFPFVTEKTLKELKIEAVVLNTKSFDLLKKLPLANEVVLGGGPLMDLEALSISLFAFEFANSKNIKKTIFGCGIGPLKTERIIAVVKRILLLADEIKLRDENSVQWVRENLGKKLKLKNSGDPAESFIRDLGKSISVLSKKPVIACFLRHYSGEYIGEMEVEAFKRRRDKFDKALASFIRQKAMASGHKVILYPMHTFYIGGDDRVYNRYMKETYLEDIDVEVIESNSSIPLIVKSMKEASFCLTMRFHSTLFADTLGMEYLAIDYTSGGKIYSFLKEKDKLDRLLTIDYLIKNFHEGNSSQRISI